MLKILSIEHKYLADDMIKIVVNLKINSKYRNIYFIYKKEFFNENKLVNIDYIFPFLYIIAYKEGFDMDIGGYEVSKIILDSLSKINLFYKKLISSPTKKVKIINYNISNDKYSTNKSGLVFSGGVDSLYSLYISNKKITHLITVLGFDIHYNDKFLISQVKDKFSKFAKEINKEIIYINTNLRDLTEEYINRNDIFGACLASIGLLLDNVLNELYISSWIDSKDYPFGSHPKLDILRSNENLKIIHYGNNISRLKKIESISKYDNSFDILRVCWENLGNKYNCGKCEKCTRTILEYTITGNHTKLKTLDNFVTQRQIEKIPLNKANFGYYDSIKESLLKMKEDKLMDYSKIIENKLSLIERNSFKQWTKNKNIIFVDFNGVISYKNFRHSFKMTNQNLFNNIQEVLFKDNIELVKLWMKGGYKSEDICKIISPKLNIENDILYNTFIEDCINIDISEKIIMQLKEMKKDYKIILVTDNMDCFSRWIVPNNKESFDIFDEIFDSSKFGFFKKENNGKIFLDFIEKYESQVENSILIDDSLNNCNAFKELGGLAHQVNGTERDVLKKIDLIKKNTKNKRLRQY